MSEEKLKKRSMIPEQLGSKALKEGEMAASQHESGFLSSMDPKWRSWWIRGIFTFVLIGLFGAFLLMGPLSLLFMITAVYLKCLQEIITIGHSKYQEHNLPLYRVLNWYFVFVATVYIVGYNLINYYPAFFSQGLPELVATYHRFTVYSLYMLGFVMFVLTLKKDHYMTQFTLFGWTHVTIFLLGTQAYLVMQNVLEGLFWFLLPVSMVICNDIMAYVFGFFFGRTKLINLSPKKTWEGFLGAFVSTVLWGLFFSYILVALDLACFSSQSACINSPMFQRKDYTVPMLGSHVSVYPAVLHSIPLSVFASLIAPFGGFFASGFKRAFKIKDFADVIPGHGGSMDRFDCQLLMASFSNVYFFTFAGVPNFDRVLNLVLALSSEQQAQLLEKLKEKLQTTT